MSDEKKRQQSVAIGVNVWLDRDPDAAAQWLDTTDAIAPEEQQRILTEREKRKSAEDQEPP